ncbi:MAG: hypothetical protein QOJ99_4461 [Bryobacterales bacterium]|jgi:CubicO group peptidase (beta-lactamase class C family)|nr:hypothetical protein [Bryobacterales bacterium]
MDTKAATTALTDVHNVTVTEAALRAHVIRPAHTEGIISSKGLEEGERQIFHFPPAPAWHFDVNGFGQALHAGLKDSVAGYVMELRQHGKVIYTLQWNWAKAPVDGAEGWNPNVRMHIASCSKLVTAVAMTRLLNEKHISFDTPIVNHLPAYWAKGPNIGKITFRHLMTHTSGFNTGSSASDFGFMKSHVAAGVTGVGQYHYQNMNFALCRILIATINGNIAVGANFGIPLLPNINDVFWDFVTIQAYAKYCQDHLFAPSGVSGPSLDHPNPDALAYKFPVNGPGWNSGDLSSMSGGAGWHMSPNDLLSVMGAFRRNNNIMSTAQAQTMLDNSFGIDMTLQTPLGKLYNKNGLWQNGSGQIEQSLAYFLPQDMELVVLTNSPIGAGNQFFRDVVTNLITANIKS